MVWELGNEVVSFVAIWMELTGILKIKLRGSDGAEHGGAVCQLQPGSSRDGREGVARLQPTEERGPWNLSYVTFGQWEPQGQEVKWRDIAGAEAVILQNMNYNVTFTVAHQMVAMCIARNAEVSTTGTHDNRAGGGSERRVHGVRFD